MAENNSSQSLLVKGGKGPDKSAVQQRTQLAFNQILKEFELDEMNDVSLDFFLKENDRLPASLLDEI